MLIAKIIENDQLIQATQANNSEIYYCPGCKARVQLKKVTLIYLILHTLMKVIVMLAQKEKQ
ncbi:MAG: hypothetical protein ACTIMJ_06710 [Weissella hellenica]|uniref:hypothetical protein n=1 Tax=Weissella hellenica TaxID=46256 RepID=UPI003F9DCD1C